MSRLLKHNVSLHEYNFYLVLRLILTPFSFFAALQMLSFCSWLKDVVKKLDNKVYWKEIRKLMSKVIRKALQGTNAALS